MQVYRCDKFIYFKMITIYNDGSIACDEAFSNITYNEPNLLFAVLIN